MIALTVVSTMISWNGGSRGQLDVAPVIKSDAWTDLAPVVNKGQFDFLVRVPENICDLSGNPSLFFICEPDPGSLGVDVLCHGPGGVVVMIGRRSLYSFNYRVSHGHLIALSKSSEIDKKNYLESA